MRSQAVHSTSITAWHTTDWRTVFAKSRPHRGERGLQDKSIQASIPRINTLLTSASAPHLSKKMTNKLTSQSVACSSPRLGKVALSSCEEEARREGAKDSSARWRTEKGASEPQLASQPASRSPTFLMGHTSCIKVAQAAGGVLPLPPARSPSSSSLPHAHLSYPSCPSCRPQFVARVECPASAAASLLSFCQAQSSTLSNPPAPALAATCGRPKRLGLRARKKIILRGGIPLLIMNWFPLEE